MMTNKGLNKLMEECGELIQIAAKKASYLETDEHPDGAGSMAKRLNDEMADVSAAMVFVAYKLRLDIDEMQERRDRKIAQFMAWDEDPSNQPTAAEPERKSFDLLDIWNERPRYVEYLDENGYAYDRKLAADMGLLKGRKYWMSSLDHGQSTTTVYLHVGSRIQGFNSVMFTEVAADSQS